MKILNCKLKAYLNQKLIIIQSTLTLLFNLRYVFSYITFENLNLHNSICEHISFLIYFVKMLSSGMRIAYPLLFSVVHIYIFISLC